GLMVACLIAGVTSAETFMVAGSALFTRNIYRNLAGPGTPRRDLLVGRLAAGGLLASGIALALWAESVTQLVVLSVQVIGLLGSAFWLGVAWRRANAIGVWSSFVAGLLAWAATGLDPEGLGDRSALKGPAVIAKAVGSSLGVRGLGRASQIALMLGVEFGTM